MMSVIFWWVRQVVLILIGVFFLVFGIQLLIAAYQLKDPFSFLMTFFASNFIILISGTLIIGFAYRMISAYRQSKKQDNWSLSRSRCSYMRRAHRVAEKQMSAVTHRRTPKWSMKWLKGDKLKHKFHDVCELKRPAWSIPIPISKERLGGRNRGSSPLGGNRRWEGVKDFKFILHRFRYCI